MRNEGKKIFVCSGCGIELVVGSDDYFPMHKDTFCRACHKKYPGWAAIRAPIDVKVDEYREKLLGDKRKEYFGDANPENKELKMNAEVAKRYEGAKESAGRGV
jgi:hypothetical protein